MNLKQALEKMHYEFIGNHTALEICSWTKKSLRDEGVCYKEKFYGIKSHRCAQMSPSAGFCDQKCVFCWRPHELNIGTRMKEGIDDPTEIIEGCIKAQRHKLTGFGGNEKVNKQKLKEAQDPNQWAISLTGEPTLYPKLGGLIEELRKRKCTTFLVTNGMHPEVLKRVNPTQLYVSIDAPTQEMHKKINIPLLKDSWKRLNETMNLLPNLQTRKVLRITLIKGLNDSHIKEWARFIKPAGDVFLEIKAYMWIGYSKDRLKKENMPRHEEIRAFSEKLAKELGWKILDESKRSRVVLVGTGNLERKITPQAL